MLEQIFKSEVFLTVISGLLLLIANEKYENLIATPNKEYKILKEKISYTMTLYCNLYYNPYKLTSNDNMRDISCYEEASKELRILASNLSGYIGGLHWFRFLKKRKLKIVRDKLIGLHNGFYQYPNYNPIEDNRECEKIIKEKLRLS